MRRQRNTTSERLSRIDRAAAKRRKKNHAYLQESVALEERGVCHFCEGRGRYASRYDDGQVLVKCRMCESTGDAHNLERLKTLLARGTAFDPKELRQSPRALDLALDGKVTTAH